MNSLEFIEKEIKELKFQINYIKSNMKKYIDFRTEGQLEVDMRQFKLNHLLQIKSVLEAWEVVKKHCDYQDSDRFNCIPEGFYSIEPIRGKDFLIVRKVLEVENND